ncbi:G patch domain-containing protein 2-like isoform X2 [Xenia sp. Carnegie-2017]|uniref:G patch domain-containing protein 2-like isoform X2 n=1 Tax=Xenia sp. Carnegie-2017 TaxID=2897299 RepID=UPI001F041093|nr:G patch domain-containing protein 2-like isoform X2 [Xenia sp. Carnegie-2017]
MASSSNLNEAMSVDNMEEILAGVGRQEALKRRAFKKRRKRNQTKIFYLLENAGKISEESDTTDEALRDYMENIAAQSDSDLENSIAKRLSSLRCQLNNLTNGCSDAYPNTEKAESDSCAEINYHKKRRKRKRKLKKMCNGSSISNNYGGSSVTLQPSMLKMPFSMNVDTTEARDINSSKHIILRAHRSRLNDDDFLADAENGHTSSWGENLNNLPMSISRSMECSTWPELPDMEACHAMDRQSESCNESMHVVKNSMSSSSDEDVFTNDEGQFGDDEREESCYETDSQCNWLHTAANSDDDEQKFHKLYRETLEYLKSKPFFLDEDQVSNPRTSGSSFLRSEMGPLTMLEVNKRIKKFLQDPTKVELRLAHVKRKDKEELSQLAELYSLHCKMEDSPRRGTVILIKTRSTSKPAQSALCHLLGRPFREMHDSHVCSPGIDVKRRKKASSFVHGLVGESAPPLSANNTGYRMLQTMGWALGQGLGPTSSGIREPVEAFKRPGRIGLGHSGAS